MKRTTDLKIKEMLENMQNIDDMQHRRASHVKVIKGLRPKIKEVTEICKQIGIELKFSEILIKTLDEEGDGFKEELKI